MPYHKYVLVCIQYGIPIIFFHGKSLTEFLRSSAVIRCVYRKLFAHTFQMRTVLRIIFRLKVDKYTTCVWLRASSCGCVRFRLLLHICMPRRTSRRRRRSRNVCDLYKKDIIVYYCFHFFRIWAQKTIVHDVNIFALNNPPDTHIQLKPRDKLDARI